MDQGYAQVTTTTDSQAEAGRLSRRMVEMRLAACAQVPSPIRSTYWWEGAVEEADEWMVVFKTSGDRLAALIEGIKGEHSYDVPDIVATPIVDGYDPYLRWIAEETEAAG